MSKASAEQSGWRLYARLWPYISRQWRTLLLIWVLTALSSATAALQPWPMKLLVDHALGSTPLPYTVQGLLERVADPSNAGLLVVTAALASLLLFVMNSALDVGISWGWTSAGQRMVYDLAGDLFHRLQRLSMLFHNRSGVGDSLSRLTGDAYCVYTVADGLLITPWQSLLTVVALGAVAWGLNPQLTLVTMAAAPVVAASSYFFGSRMKQRAKQSREAEARLLAFVQQVLSALPLVQAFDRAGRNGAHFHTLAEHTVTVSQRGVLVNSSFNVVNGLAQTVSMALVLWLGARGVLSGALTVGGLLVFVAYLRTLQGSASALLKTYASLKSAEAQIDRVLEVLEAEERVVESPTPKSLPQLPSGQRGHVELEGVTFGYDPERPVLREISLEARPGETIALVGHTGAGKSTLVSLLPRFFDPQQGRVLLDGVEVRDLRLSELRAQFSLVLQEPFLLPLTIAENIAYGRPDASREEIEAAARAANAHGFIERLPQGYDTVVGERGATLSGGEKQRLAIARALLKDAPVLILDEPTSALDVETEGLLLEALGRLMQGRTTFIIAHRLSTIRNADRIAVLQDGRIVEIGSHHELLHTGGVYHRLNSYSSLETRQEVLA